MQKLFAMLFVALAVSACGTTPVAMSYKAPPSAAPFAPSAGNVSVGPFVDNRGEPPKWLGAIRGGFGNPLKVLEVDDSVSALVTRTFREGARARGGPANAPGRYEIRGSIRKFDCSQYVRREAHIVVDLTVVEVATGRERYRQSYSADNVDGAMVSLSTGIFASVDDLRLVAEKTLQDVVDKALDDTRLRAALGG